MSDPFFECTTVYELVSTLHRLYLLRVRSQGAPGSPQEHDALFSISAVCIAAALMNLLARRLYTLRVRAQGAPGSPKEHDALFSMPAACFAAALAGAHRLDLHLSPAGWLTGLEIRHHPDLDCSAVPVAAQFPALTDVKALFPSPGVTMNAEVADGAPRHRAPCSVSLWYRSVSLGYRSVS